MFTVYRYFYKYGYEGSPLDVTIKDFSSYEKAKAYGNRYAKGTRFCSFEIRAEKDGKEYTLYEDIAGGETLEIKENLEIFGLA